jgi:hypothetical protein
MHLPPVHVAIVAFRGTRPLAAAIGRAYQNVQEWARPAAAGGRDGEFPNPIIMRQVYQAAQERGLRLELVELFFGKDLTPEEVAKLKQAMPQHPWAWYRQLPAHAPAPSPAPQRGR